MQKSTLSAAKKQVLNFFIINTCFYYIKYTQMVNLAPHHISKNPNNILFLLICNKKIINIKNIVKTLVRTLLTKIYHFWYNCRNWSEVFHEILYM